MLSVQPAFYLRIHNLVLLSRHLFFSSAELYEVSPAEPNRAQPSPSIHIIYNTCDKLCQVSSPLVTYLQAGLSPFFRTEPNRRRNSYQSFNTIKAELSKKPMTTPVFRNRDDDLDRF